MMKLRRPRLITLVILPVFLFATTALAQDSESKDAPDEASRTEKAFDQKVDDAVIANFVVNNNGDGTDVNPGDGICETVATSGICTLRAAITEANTLAGDDVISFAPSVTSISVNGQIIITANLTINGPGPSVLTIQNIAVPSATSRVFDVTAGDALTISGVTISGGGVNTGDGGGIRTAGTLTIDNCVITNNVNTGASSNGGGVRGSAGSTVTITNSLLTNNRSANSGGLSFAGATLTISNTTIRENSATTGNGGGANIASTVGATISRSTISGNSAFNSSGGMFITRGTITHSTISGNTANGATTNGGGGVRIQAGANTVSFQSCTITLNTAPNAASGARSGIWHETGTVTIASSIVAGNVAQDIQRDGTAVMTNSGFNLIGENTSVTTEFPDGLPNGTNYVGTDAAPLNPMLGSLAYNGGPTFTHAVLEGSVAIDHGNSNSATSDQRGYVRIIDLGGTPNTPGGDGSDIGSFEYSSAPLLVVSVGGRVTTAGGVPIGKAIVVLTDGGGNSRLALTNPLGYYQFGSVGAFENYTVSVHSKGYAFTPRVITPNDNIFDLDFIPTPN